MRFALSLGLFAGSITGAFGQAPATLPSALPTQSTPITSSASSSAGTVADHNVVANPFASCQRTVDVIPPTVSEQITAEKIMMAPHFWGSAQYEILWPSNAGSPSLVDRIPAQFVTTGNSVSASNRASLFPNSRELRYQALNALKFNAGYRFSQESAIDGSYFSTESGTKKGVYSGNGNVGTDGISRPYIQAGTGNVVSLYSVLPGSYGGFVSATTRFEASGGDINYRRDTYHFFVDRTEFLAGFRYFNMNESVVIEDRSNLASATFLTRDEFRTRNNFYGGQVGFHSRFYGPVWSIDFINKFAMGGVNQEVQAIGSNTIINSTGASVESGGLYARGANLGTFERTRFAVTNETEMMVGYAVSQNVRLHIGYRGLWTSSVVRATEAIDSTVNDSQVRFIAQQAQSNLNRPAFAWRASDLYIHGITFGATIGY
jgi:hypothetical protein